MGRPHVSSFRDEVPEGAGSGGVCAISPFVERPRLCGGMGGGAAPPFTAHIFGKSEIYICIQKYTKEISPQTTNLPLLSDRSLAHYWPTMVLILVCSAVVNCCVV